MQVRQLLKELPPERDRLVWRIGYHHKLDQQLKVAVFRIRDPQNVNMTEAYGCVCRGRGKRQRLRLPQRLHFFLRAVLLLDERREFSSEKANRREAYLYARSVIETVARAYVAGRPKIDECDH